VEYRWGSLVLTNKNQFKVDLAASYITTQWHNPEDQDFNLHCCKNKEFA
jgi:hypothetical protein